MDEIALGRDIFKGKGNISISVLNFFLDNRSQEQRWNDYFKEKSYYESDTRCVMIRFSYFFTKGKKLKNIDRVLNMESDEK